MKLCQTHGNLCYSEWVYYLCLLCITWTSVMQVCCLLCPRSLFIITTIISSCLVTWNLSLHFFSTYNQGYCNKMLKIENRSTINMRSWLSVCHHIISHKYLFIRGHLIVLALKGVGHRAGSLRAFNIWHIPRILMRDHYITPLGSSTMKHPDFISEWLKDYIQSDIKTDCLVLE